MLCTFHDTARNTTFEVEADVLPEAMLFVERHMPEHWPVSTVQGSDTLLPDLLRQMREMFTPA